MSVVRVLLLALVAALCVVCVSANGPLSRPLIEGVLSSPEKRTQLSNVADIIKAELADHLKRLDRDQALVFTSPMGTPLLPPKP